MRGHSIRKLREDEGSHWAQDVSADRGNHADSPSNSNAPPSHRRSKNQITAGLKHEVKKPQQHYHCQEALPICPTSHDQRQLK
ncbi:MAG TPA: hypothetical protein ACQGQW_03165, partial [Xylella fastidiosa subsp. pauca]